jgi:hypothetical protein
MANGKWQMANSSCNKAPVELIYKRDFEGNEARVLPRLLANFRDATCAYAIG